MPQKRVRVTRGKGRELSPQVKRHISGIVQICVGVLLLLVLRDAAGAVGTVFNRILIFFFGSWGVLFPLALLASGVLTIFSQGSKLEVKRSLGLVVALFSFLGLMHIGAGMEDIGTKRDQLAGAVGFMMSFPFVTFTSRAVGYVVLATMFIVGVFLAFEPDVGAFIASLKENASGKKPQGRRTAAIVEEDLDDAVKTKKDEDEEEEEDFGEAEEPELNIVRPAFAKSDDEETPPRIQRKAVARGEDDLQMKDMRFEEWTFPSFDLLDVAKSELMVDDEKLKQQARLIEEKLWEFGIEVTVRDARPGPTVTQFTLQPAEGIKISRIESLKDDLTLALAAQSLRIEAPIPGKSLVGIEMPNDVRTIVHLREILESPAFQQSESSLALPLGRDVSGEAIVANLDQMPHLLIAGATGSGKSVCMNTFLSSLLFQNAPDELKFILIDPKRVELSPYDGIPHLLTPVITEAEKALQALRWTVAEMGRRLKKYSEAKVRNISEFNDAQEDDANHMPRIVIVIDELADLMMRQYRRDTEMMITRIAQMARATGIHLIIATQRPSVDVITGLIKANIPTRIAFRTVSSIDARTILDSIGSEDLLGQGDMLYMTASTPRPIRIQGIYVSTKEVTSIINAVKIAGGGRITEQIGIGMQQEEGAEGEAKDAGVSLAGGIDLEADDNGGDDLFFDAVQVVQMSGKASATLLQRQLKVGYSRAARLLDIMEEKGLIGPVDGAKARKVYMEKTAA